MPHLPCMRPVTAAMINTFHGNSGGRVAQLVDPAHRGRNSVLARGESSEVETGSATEGYNPMCRRSSFVEGNFMKVSSASSHCLYVIRRGSRDLGRGRAGGHLAKWLLGWDS